MNCASAQIDLQELSLTKNAKLLCHIFYFLRAKLPASFHHEVFGPCARWHGLELPIQALEPTTLYHLIWPTQLAAVQTDVRIFIHGSLLAACEAIVATRHNNDEGRRNSRPPSGQAPARKERGLPFSSPKLPGEEMHRRGDQRCGHSKKVNRDGTVACCADLSPVLSWQCAALTTHTNYFGKHKLFRSVDLCSRSLVGREASLASGVCLLATC